MHVLWSDLVRCFSGGWLKRQMHLDASMKLNNDLRADLHWWASFVEGWNGVSIMSACGCVADLGCIWILGLRSLLPSMLVQCLIDSLSILGRCSDCSERAVADRHILCIVGPANEKWKVCMFVAGAIMPLWLWWSISMQAGTRLPHIYWGANFHLCEVCCQLDDRSSAWSPKWNCWCVVKGLYIIYQLSGKQYLIQKYLWTYSIPPELLGVLVHHRPNWLSAEWSEAFQACLSWELESNSIAPFTYTNPA